MTFEVHINRYIDLDFPHQKPDIKLNCREIVTSSGSNVILKKCKMQEKLKKWDRPLSGFLSKWHSLLIARN